MGTTYIQLELPRDIYDRLESIAETRQIDPVTLIQYWLEAMEQSEKSSSAPEPVSAPIYQVHEHAVDMGVSDLAENFDHYLYGHDKLKNSQ